MLFPAPGLLIYFGYGMWNSTLEISAREEALHQSTYQRYDVDVDPFSVDDGFSYAAEGESYPGWAPPRTRASRTSKWREQRKAIGPVADRKAKAGTNRPRRR